MVRPPVRQIPIPREYVDAGVARVYESGFRRGECGGALVRTTLATMQLVGNYEAYRAGWQAGVDQRHGGREAPHRMSDNT